MRNFSDLIRPEIIARAKFLEILRARVVYIHNNFSPRRLMAFAMATLMLTVAFALTDALFFRGFTCLSTLIGVLRYSRLPMTWHAQLKDGISRLECLRSSPLRHIAYVPDTHYDWHYAPYCLAAEIQLIHAALSQPAKSFSTYLFRTQR